MAKELLFLLFLVIPTHGEGKVCLGTNARFSVSLNREFHYQNLKTRYTNCTFIEGNLELTWLQDENLNLSFLKDIRVVTGHVLIAHVDVKRVILPRLHTIRGRTLLKINTQEEKFGLFVTLSKMHTLELPSLRDVYSGSIGFFNNLNLCYIRSIDWREISESSSRFIYVHNYASPERDCPPCHKNCQRGCWGEREENCQKFSKENCSPQCYHGSCFGPGPRQCCHIFCTGGCTGPKQSDCVACRNFYDDGVCTQECPPLQIYNPVSLSWQDNPERKYAYGDTCVKNCPEHLVVVDEACVEKCPPDKKKSKGSCVPHDKTCTSKTLIHSGNIDSFKGCRVVEGNIVILQSTFDGFQEIDSNYSLGERYPPMHPSRLKVFKSLKKITGYFVIEGNHEDFTDLSSFRNLKTIGGTSLYEYFSSLYIVQTSLKSLGLSSLQKINAGSVVILKNRQLCFVGHINWSKIRSTSSNTTFIATLGGNSDPNVCQQLGLVCDSTCNEDGCWGAGSDQCVK